jgi:hypothetical protein
MWQVSELIPFVPKALANATPRIVLQFATQWMTTRSKMLKGAGSDRLSRATVLAQTIQPWSVKLALKASCDIEICLWSYARRKNSWLGNGGRVAGIVFRP